MQAQVERVSGDGSLGDAGEQFSVRLLWLRGFHAARHAEVGMFMQTARVVALKHGSRSYVQPTKHG